MEVPSPLQLCAGFVDRESLIQSVLGNHDIYLLGRWSGACSKKKRDTLDELLEAADADRLLQWLLRRPLTLSGKSYRIIHAGTPPSMEMERCQIFGEGSPAADPERTAPGLSRGLLCL